MLQRTRPSTSGVQRSAIGSPCGSWNLGGLVFGLARSAPLAVALLALSPWAMAQEPTAKAVHCAGQTFLTWQEIEGTKEYRVYRAGKPIRDTAHAACVGSVDEDSTLNFRAAAGDILDQQRQKKDSKRPSRPRGPIKRDLEADPLAAARRDPVYHFVTEPGGKPLPKAIPRLTFRSW